MFTYLLLRELQNYNSLLNNQWQENVGSHQKKISLVQEQMRSPSKTVGGAKSRIKSNPTPTRDTWRAQTKPCVHQDPDTPRDGARPVFESPAVVRVSSGLLQGQGPCVQLLGSHSLWHKPSWRRSPLYHQRAAKQTIHKLQNNYTKDILALLRKF